MGNGGDLGGRSQKRRQKSVGSVGADQGYLDINSIYSIYSNKEEAEREALHITYLVTSIESVCPLCRVRSLIEVFVAKYR